MIEPERLRELMEQAGMGALQGQLVLHTFYRCGYDEMFNFVEKSSWIYRSDNRYERLLVLLVKERATS